MTTIVVNKLRCYVVGCVQGHPRSLISVQIESAHATSY